MSKMSHKHKERKREKRVLIQFYGECTFTNNDFKKKEHLQHKQ